MLKSIIVDTKLAWNRTTFRSQMDFTFNLRPETVKELKNAILKLDEEIGPDGGGEVDSSQYPNLKEDIDKCRIDYLEKGYGIVLIAGLDPNVFLSNV